MYRKVEQYHDIFSYKIKCYRLKNQDAEFNVGDLQVISYRNIYIRENVNESDCK